MLFQWHITERCNLRCSHCYQETYSRMDTSLQDAEKVLIQFKDLVKHINHEKLYPAHINFSGGEPFLNNDFLDILKLVADDGSFSIGILTNGTYIDKGTARILKKLSISFVQLSLDGIKSTHDHIRGKNNFDATLKAAKILVSEGVKTHISFTAHKDNYHEFQSVARTAAKIKAHKVWSDRFLPSGSGKSMQEKVLSADETEEYVKSMFDARSEIEKNIFNKTIVGMDRALQFLCAANSPYGCTAGRTLLAIDTNGDVFPCRRMPVVVGNLHETGLTEIYFKNPFLQQLRSNDSVPEECRNCLYSSKCRGGLKCLSYACFSNPNEKDPGCWLNFQ